MCSKIHSGDKTQHIANMCNGNSMSRVLTWYYLTNVLCNAMQCDCVAQATITVHGYETCLSDGINQYKTWHDQWVFELEGFEQMCI